jgi:hypothetical protein
LSGSAPLAAVSCAIEIYPFEGGSYFIKGGQVKSVTVEKTLRDGANGRFEIELAPGGPAGPESIPDWIQVITPASHVLIGMSRGADAAIVMDGVVTVPSEDQAWQTTQDGSTAARTQVVVGADFAWFFNAQNWYSLAMYGLTAGIPLGNQLGYLPASFSSILGQGILGQAGPVQVGKIWFEKIMAASGGILGQTFVPYQGGNTRLPFRTLIGETLEQYPRVQIPYTEQFLGLESWVAKFQDIFPWPWYEFFVTTAPSGAYALLPAASGGPANVVASGRTFTMRDFPTALPAGPQMVARINPVPRFDFTVSGSGSTTSVSIGGIDVSRWNALPLNQLSAYGLYESRVEFSSDEARNFYLLNPTAYLTSYGNNGSNAVPFPFVFLAAADPASVHRYGYKPADGTLRWFLDWEGTTAKQGLASPGTVNIPQSVATMTAALASQWHPLPLMARGQIEIALAPNIRIGTRWRHAPFKDGIPWDFYVEGVRHRFVFGGHSTTTLTLTRGLPASVYADANGLLKAVCTGNARRQDGTYKVGLPADTGQALQVFSTPESAAALAGKMAAAFATPQWPSQ